MKKKYIIIFTILALLKINLTFSDDYANKDDSKKHFFYAPYRESYLEEALNKKGKKKKKKKECFFCKSTKRNPIKKNVLIKKFRYTIGDDGLFVSEVEPVEDENVMEEIRKIVLEKYPSSQVEFFCP